MRKLRKETKWTQKKLLEEIGKHLNKTEEFKDRVEPDKGLISLYELHWPEKRESNIVDAIPPVFAAEIISIKEAKLKKRGDKLDNREIELGIKEEKIIIYLKICPYDENDLLPQNNGKILEQEAEALLLEIMDKEPIAPAQSSEPTTEETTEQEPTAKITPDYHGELSKFPELQKSKDEFVGRTAIKKEIEEFLKNEDQGYFLITGEPGIGKTALMANLYHDLKPYSSNEQVIYYSFKRDSFRCSLQSCINHIYLSLAQKHGIDANPPPNDLEEMAEEFSLLLQKTALRSEQQFTNGESANQSDDNTGRTNLSLVSDSPSQINEIFLIDAIDEAEDTLLVLRLLPKELPDRVFFILSSRPTTTIDDCFDALSATNKKLDINTDIKNSLDDAACFLKKILSEWSIDVLKQAAHASQGNFLFLKLFSDLVRRFEIPPDEGLRIAKEFGSKKDPLAAIYSKYWGYLREEAQKSSSEDWKHINELLGLISISYTGLTRQQILQFLDGSWSTTQYENIMQYIRQFIEISSFINIQNGQLEDTYLLFHETFKEYLRNRLSSDLPKIHGQILHSYKKNNAIEHSALDEYGIKYLVKHAAYSDTPNAAFEILTPAYVRHKTACLKSIAPVLNDLSVIVATAAKERDLISTFKYSLLRARLVKAPEKRMLGIETILRARNGEVDSILEDVDLFGTLEDRILARAELVVQQWEINREFAKKVLLELEAMPLARAPHALEMAALRIAKADPVTALELGKRIPEPEHFDNMSKENPTKGRFIFSFYKLLTTDNLGLARTLAETEKDEHEKIYAYIAIGCALILTRPEEAIESYKMAISLLTEERNKRDLEALIARFILCHLNEMNFDSSVSALKGVSGFIEFEPSSLEVRKCIDVKIHEAPKLWIKILDDLQLPYAALKDFLKWRLIALRYMPLSKPDDFLNAKIRDVIRAEHIVQIVKEKSDVAVKMAKSLETLAGFARAMAGHAMQLKNQKEAESLIKKAFEAVSKQGDLDGFDAGLELLKAAIRWPGHTRQVILAWCLSLTKKLEPEPARQDAVSELEKVLAASFVESKPNEAHFFISLISEIDHEPARPVIAQSIIAKIPVAACKNIFNNKAKFGLKKETKTSKRPLEKPLFPSEYQIEILINLAARFTDSDSQLASKIINHAADILVSLEDFEKKKEYCSKIIRCAMNLSPIFAWKVFDRCGFDQNEFVSITGAFLRNSYAFDRDVNERFVRLHLELSLVADNPQKIDPKFSTNTVMLMGGVYNTQISPIDGYFSKCKSLTDEWTNELPDFFTHWIEHSRLNNSFSNNLYEIAEFVLQTDWNIFMKMVRVPFLGSHVAGNIYPEPLRKCLFESKSQASVLLEDLKDIQQGKEEADKVEPVWLAFYKILIAAAAAYDPNACLEMISSITPKYRDRFTGELEQFRLEANWTEQQLYKLFGLLKDKKDNDEAVIAKAQMMAWLGRYSELKQDLLNEDEINAIQKSSSLRIVAEHFRLINPEISHELMLKALEHAVNAQDADEVCKLVEEADSIEPKTALKALQLTREAVAQSANQLFLKKIAKQQARLNPEKAVGTISMMLPDNSFLEDTLVCLAESLEVKNDDDIEHWLLKISRLQNLKEKNVSRFAWTLIKRGLELGVVRSDKTFKYIKETDSKVKAITEFSKILDEEKKKNILSKACLEADKPADEYQKVKAFCTLAENYLSYDQNQALKYYKSAITEAMKYENAQDFAFDTRRFVRACFKLKAELAKELALGIYKAAREYPYEKRLYSDDAKARSLVWTGIAFWPFRKVESAAIFKESVEDFKKKITTSDAITSWWFDVSVACTELANQCGTGTAKEMLRELLKAMPDNRKKETADKVSNCFCDHSKGEEPLKHMNIDQKRLDNTACELVRYLLPRCSPIGAARIRLALGISAYGKNPHIAAQEIEQAAKITEEIGLTCSYANEEIWIVYAALHGFEGCIYSANRMAAPYIDILQRNLTSLFKIAIDDTTQKKDFILDTWLSLQEIESYM